MRACFADVLPVFLPRQRLADDDNSNEGTLGQSSPIIPRRSQYNHFAHTHKKQMYNMPFLGKYWDPSGREVGRYASGDIYIRYSRTHTEHDAISMSKHLMHSYTFKEEASACLSSVRPVALHTPIINKHKCVGGDTEEPSATRQRPTIYYIRGDAE